MNTLKAAALTAAALTLASCGAKQQTKQSAPADVVPNVKTIVASKQTVSVDNT